MLNTLKACIEILEIKKPVRVIMRTKAATKPTCGDCVIIVGKKGIRYHRINLYIPTIEDSKFQVNGILAHELIHAWQFEYVPEYYGGSSKIVHGILFAKTAEYLRITLLKRGIYIPARDLYNPDTDTP